MLPLDPIIVWLVPCIRALLSLSLFVYPKWLINSFPLSTSDDNETTVTQIIRGLTVLQVGYAMLEHAMFREFDKKINWRYVPGILVSDVATISYLIQLRVRHGGVSFFIVGFSVMASILFLKIIHLCILVYVHRRQQNSVDREAALAQRRATPYVLPSFPSPPPRRAWGE